MATSPIPASRQATSDRILRSNSNTISPTITASSFSPTDVKKPSHSVPARELREYISEGNKFMNSKKTNIASSHYTTSEKLDSFTYEDHHSSPTHYNSTTNVILDQHEKRHEFEREYRSWVQKMPLSKLNDPS